MPTDDNTIYNYNGYNIHPSAFGATELSVTTPEVVVRPNPADRWVIKDKEYQATPLGLMSALYDKVTDSDQYLQSKDYVGEIRQDDRSPLEKQLTYKLQHNNNPLGYLAQTVVPSAVAAGTITGLGATAGAIAAGPEVAVPLGINAIEYGIPATIAGSAVNYGTQGMTGKSFADLAGQMTNSSVGDIYNPGYFGSYYFTRGALGRARKALFNNVTPYGYNNAHPNATISKKDELKDFAKDLFDPRRKIDVSPNADPAWKKRLIANTFNGEDLANIDFREEAYRKALLLPSKYPLYTDNYDGTWSYNTKFINDHRQKYGVTQSVEDKPTKIFTDNGNGTYVSGDQFALNGGYTGLINNHDGTFTMKDMWDIHPFSDGRALFGVRFPGSQYVEAMQLLGGKPFMVEHTFKPSKFVKTASKPNAPYSLDNTTYY